MKFIDFEKENQKTWILLDKLGSGTDPAEGMGLATSILERLYVMGSMIAVTTRYSKIKTFSKNHPGFLNGSMEVDLEILKPTYRLISGNSGDSQAFQIAIELGMHSAIIERAHEITYSEKRKDASPYQGVS